MPADSGRDRPAGVDQRVSHAWPERPRQLRPEIPYLEESKHEERQHETQQGCRGVGTGDQLPEDRPEMLRELPAVTRMTRKIARTTGRVTGFVSLSAATARITVITARSRVPVPWGWLTAASRRAK